MTYAGSSPAEVGSPSAGDSPGPAQRPRPGARSTSLDTRHEVHNGRSGRRQTRAPRARLHRGSPPVDRLRHLFRDPAERELTKLDLADVLEEVARRRHEAGLVEDAYWFDERSAALRECTFVRVIEHRGTDHGVARPLACHVRGCPDCERTRAARIVARYDGLAADMSRPVMWTWTVRNVPQGELERGLRELRKAFGKLRRRAIFRGGRCRWRWSDGTPGHPCHPPVPAADCTDACPTRTGRRAVRCPVHPPSFAHPNGCPRSCPHHGHDRRANCPAFEHAPVVGGVVSGEVTWSEDDRSWHPHLHALIDSPWIAWSEMRDLWRSLTCTTAGCRHACTRCRGIAAPATADRCARCGGTGTEPICTGAWSVWVEAIPQDDDERRRGAIREVLKYVGKPGGLVDSLDPERIGEYLWATRRQRLVTGWGSLYRIQDDEAEPAGADELVIRGFGFGSYRVPRICPCCGAVTTEDDWLVPFRRPRLEAVRLEGTRLFGWRRPPPGMARGVAAGFPVPDSIATSVVTTSAQLAGGWSWERS